MKKKYFRWQEIIFPFLLIIISGWLFLKNLGDIPLKSWDEAWYAQISRNITEKNQWFLMQWNGLPYYDHPPLGFWLMAVSFKLFGVNEFSARLPSAFCGIGSILLIYFIGKKLFNKTTGFSAGLILTAMPWYWLRSREGNLDIILTFFSLLTIYFALKIKESNKYLLWLSVSFALMLLTKTIIGIGLIPLLIYLIVISKPKIKILLFSLGLFFATLIPWYLINYLKHGFLFIDRNIFVTGLKIASFKSLDEKIGGLKFFPAHNLYNLHMGILLWYKPFLISVTGSLLFLKKRSFQIIFLWILPFLFFFFTSDKTELWHFIIIYPVVALFIPAFIYQLFNTIKLEKIGIILTFLLIFYFGFRTVKGLYHDIVKYQPLNDQVILSQLASNYTETIFIDDDYWPAAVFYSGKKIYSIPHSIDTDIKTVKMLFDKYPKSFLLLTKDWILLRETINLKEYEVIKQINDRVLVKSK